MSLKSNWRLNQWTCAFAPAKGQPKFRQLLGSGHQPNNPDLRAIALPLSSGVTMVISDGEIEVEWRENTALFFRGPLRPKAGKRMLVSMRCLKPIESTIASG